MTNPGPKSTKNLSTKDLIEQSKKKQEERSRQINAMKEDKEKEVAYMQALPNTIERIITDDQHQQEFIGDPKKDNKTLANWQRGRIAASETKQPSGYSNRYKTSGNVQPPLSLRQEEIEKKRKEEEEKDPQKRAIKELQERGKNKITKIKQKTGQTIKKTGQIASQAGKMVARGLVQAGGWLVVTAGGLTGCLTGCAFLLLIVILLVAIAYVYQTCNDNAASSAICDTALWLTDKASWLYNQF